MAQEWRGLVTSVKPRSCYISDWARPSCFFHSDVLSLPTVLLRYLYLHLVILCTNSASVLWHCESSCRLLRTQRKMVEKCDGRRKEMMQQYMSVFRPPRRRLFRKCTLMVIRASPTNFDAVSDECDLPRCADSPGIGHGRFCDALRWCGWQVEGLLPPFRLPTSVGQRDIPIYDHSISHAANSAI